MIRMSILKGNLAGSKRAGRLMQLHSARRELELAHVPQQQRAGHHLSEGKMGGGRESKVSAPAAASARPMPRAKPQVTHTW
jgi:hypothetical protein